MIYAIRTEKDINIVKSELEDKAKKAGFGVLNVYEFQNILENKGFPITRDITVFELCNPAGAQKALSEMAAVSIYLPCRLSVYEENGVTILATIGIDDILNTIEVNEHFKSFMGILFEDIKNVMHSWDN